MLELKNITKEYAMNSETVHALRGVSTVFRKNEFVAILGHSGCGKTTLLNIIGGLDQYTDGDLVINGVSTKKYKDRDWDAYRNHSVGFVFQSYNLIPHQTVLANVELALTISGISRSERRKRAVAALEKVGLGDQLKKKPNQMSGGQMQRVAIARALVNDPEILLADEPTGALDSETSVQVMELIREIARDRLVIMVTHNPELAEEYATRIIRIKDGLLIDDSNPCTPEEAAPAAIPEKKQKKNRKDRVSMSLFTALSLSLNNLMTKKGRTFMTSFAGSIGIIGIALILSLSNGINTYINGIQRETLSSYPITITKESDDSLAMMQGFMQQNVSDGVDHELDAVYANTVMYDMVNTMFSAEKNYNNLEKFKVFLDTDEEIAKYASAIQYGYDLNMPIYTKDVNGVIMEVDLGKLVGDALGETGAAMMTSEYSMFSQMDIFQEMLTDENGGISKEITDNYEVVYGDWPKADNEAVLVVTQNNEISDLMLYALCFKESVLFADLMKQTMSGEVIEDIGETRWTYEDICNKKYKIVLPIDKYVPLTTGSESGSGYRDLSTTSAGLEYLYNSEDVGTELKIVGIIRPGEDAEGMALTGTIAYTKGLTDHLLERFENSDIIKAQTADPTVDAILGLPFMTEDTVLPTDEEKAATFREKMADFTAAKAAEIYRYIMAIPTDEQISAVIDPQIGQMTREDVEKMVVDEYAAEMGVDAETIMGYISQMTDEELFASIREKMVDGFTAQYAEDVAAGLAGLPDEALQMQLTTAEWTESQLVLMYDEFMPATHSESTYEENLTLLGKCDMNDPDSVNIYAESFANKDKISEIIADYNKTAAEEDVIEYTDLIEMLMSSITDIISGVSYLLIAFVSISLVVSSIMIGIITYISVLERTREIGILRAIGASKRDISNVFNAETMIVGFVSGALGIGVTVLLCIPINAIIHYLTDLVELKAVLPPVAGIVLVAISIALTLIAGVIPSRVAANKDPVVALRTE
ncbi:MAG: ABC transporter ATP-binding protein/permease [Clostridia bacterium]|nr:ABC transporter ATP-binding protein/permease [Clostridia bacterium]